SARRTASAEISCDDFATTTSSAVTRPAAMAVCAWARLSNKPRSTSSRSMRIRQAMQSYHQGTKGGGRRRQGGAFALWNQKRRLAVVSSRLAVTRAAERVLTPARINRELNHGTTIFTRCFEGCRARNAQAQTRDSQERQKRKKGEKPQAGHRHRPRGGAQGRKKGPAQIQITGRLSPLPASELHRFALQVLAERLERRGDDAFGVQAGLGIHRRA